MSPLTGVALVVIAIVAVGLGFQLYRKRTRHSRNSHIWTGLRTIDVFVPIARGQSVLVSGDEKAGARVLGTELMYRLIHHPDENFHVLYYVDSTLGDLEDWKKELQTTLPKLASYQIVSGVNSDALVQAIRGGSAKQVAVFALSFQQSFLDSFHRAIDQARTELQARKNITSFAISELCRSNSTSINIIVSRDLATAAIYPAIDIEQSNSVLNANVSQNRRLRIAATVKLMASEVMKDLYPEAVNDPQWQYNSDSTLRPALQALLFHSQPLFVATPFTGMQAVFVKEHDAIADYERIAAGSLNALPNASFRFKNFLQA
jgi:F0F1-type ATP synthase beta subunit